MDERDQMMVEESEKVYNIKHRAYQFSKNVVLFIGSIKFERIYHSIFDQLIRSSTSIGANLVEATAGSSTNDFIKFYTIALKSANETKYWLCLVRDTIDVDKNIVVELLNEADEISKIVASIIVATKGR